jgi:two-component system, OmpR family, phosphate regulon sensor histidine kinase PhoR
MKDIPEESIQTKCKGERWLHTKKIPICDPQGAPQYLLGISEDITDRKRSDQAKTEFIGLASHQLRTPLTEIRWALSSLQREHFDKEQQHLIDGAHRAAVHMTETIKTMLTISHIETGELHTKSVAVNLRDVLDSTVELYSLHQHKKALNVELECPSRMTLRTDDQLLREILGNIISNAYKYTPQGGDIRIVAQSQGTDVRISITDTGYGIPQSEQPQVFTKFFRASNIVDKEEAGSGIGLYMVYALTKILGGTISCTSEVNKGTTFILTFPPTL